jgi:L-threonylcarbamoyladenylate synthase
MALTLSVSLDAPEDKPLVLAAEVVQAGGLIVYPTETIYGIGSNALNRRGIARIQALKRRSEPRPILVLVPTIESVVPLVERISATGLKFMEAFWPGPLTLVFSASRAIPEELTQGKGTIGIRIPCCTLCIRLLELCQCPITSTSANLSGEVPLTSIEEMKKVLTPGIDLYLDAGVLPPSKPSTVVDVSEEIPRLVREGAVSAEALRAVFPGIAVEARAL